MSRDARTTVVLSIILFAVVVTGSRAQDEAADDLAERKIADRFASVLEKNPRRGTAFDKVYAHHAEVGSLDELLKTYRDKGEAAQGAVAAANWMIVGLIESKRGRDSDAIRAYGKAEALDPTNSMASFLLGQSLVLTGQSKEAAEAFERAIQRKPAPSDLMEVFQSLGRVYQRTQKNDKALEVWNQLEKQFPNDPRVQEQIATTLLEENDLVAALPRFENLARTTRDKYRQSLFLVEAAEIKVRLNRADEALIDFEKLLGQLNPDNWLFHDVRRRVESVFLKSEDQAGLVDYYQAWMEKNPEDLDAASRLARLLASAGRGKEAQALLRQTLKKAPSNKELRSALVAQLLNGHLYREAVEQYQELDRIEPNNPDTLRDWGRAVLKDSSRQEETRRKEAASVWRKLLAARPQDPHAAAQVADLFRQAEMIDDAIVSYRRAIELAPDSEQYREYLGDYLHSLKRKGEALAVWREIASGSRKTAPNLARMAEILARHDQLADATEANAEACRLDPKDFNLQLRQADLLAQADKLDQSLQQLADVRKIAANDEEREACLKRELQTLKKLNRLTRRIVDFRMELEENDTATAEQWYWIARAEEANDQPRIAIRAITKAISLDPNSVPILLAGARLNESQQHLPAAVEFYTKLTTANRRFRTEYLKRISILEEKRGNTQKALQAGRDLLAASPGNSESVDFFAQLCFRAGRRDEAIQILRRSLRTNPDDLPTRLKLASVLSESGQAPEAIEILWQAFDRANKLDERLSVVQQLATAHAKSGQLKNLYARLERESREPARHREMTFCLARAYEAAGDAAVAQQTLESLLGEETRDAVLLAQLRNLAEQQRNMATAIRYQRQLWKLTGNRQDGFHLAQLLLQEGDAEEAIELVASATESTELNADVLRLVDSLGKHGRIPEALARIRQLRKRFPDNWELLYREGVLQVDMSSGAAKKCFTALLELNLPEDLPSVMGQPAQPVEMPTETRLPLIERLSDLLKLNFAKNSLPVAQQAAPAQTQSVQITFGTQITPSVWTPSDYGGARLAAWYWRLRLANRLKDDPKHPIATVFPELNAPEGRQQQIDSIFVHRILNHTNETLEAARQFMHQYPDDIEAKVLFLKIIDERNRTLFAMNDGQTKSRIDGSVPPLGTGELDEALAVYRELAGRRDLIPLNITYLRGLTRELTLSMQENVASQLVSDAAAKVTTPIEVSLLLGFDRKSKDFAFAIKLLDRLIEMPDLPINSPAASLRKLSAQSELKSSLPLHLMTNVLPALQRDGRIDDMLAIWNRYLRLSARRLAEQPVGALSGLPGNQIPFVAEAPPSDHPGSIISSDMIQLLTPIRRHYLKTSRIEELIAIFEKDCQNAEQTAEERLFRQHTIAHLLLTNGRRDQAIALLEKSAGEHPARKDLRLRLARQLTADKQPAKALAMLDSVSGDTAEEQRELERMAFKLAIAAMNHDRAKSASVGICTGSIDKLEVTVIVAELMKSKLNDSAELILKQAGEARPLDYSELRSLMSIQLELGKKDDATATAMSVLEQLADSQPANYVRAQSRKNPRKPAEKLLAEESRELQAHCYRVLKETGRLAEMIETTEKLVETAPDPKEPINQLIAYYSAIGNNERVVELKNLHPDSTANRLESVLKSLEAGASPKSIAEVKRLIAKDPDFFASRFHSTLLRFEERKELSVCISVLQKVDWCDDERQMPAFVSIVEQLKTFPATAEAADQLFIKEWEANPDHRLDLLIRFADHHWWNLKPVRDAFPSILAPSKRSRAKNRIRILGQSIRSPDTGTRLVTLWNRLLTTAANCMTLDEWASEVEQGIKHRPDWAEGEVMLAMIDLRRGRIEAGQSSLEALLPKVEARFPSRSVITWEIAQELSNHAASLDLATRYYRITIRRTNEVNWMSATSPAGAMIDAYLSHNRVTDARKLLLQSVPDVLCFNPASVLNPSSATINQTISIGGRLQSVNAPIDAIEVYLAALQRLGDNPNPKMQANLRILFGELNPESLAQYLEEFDATYQQLHLYISVHQPTPDQSRIQGHWDTLLSRIATDRRLADRTQAEFERLETVQTDTIVPQVLSAQLWLSTSEQDRANASVDKLTRWIEAHPLPKERIQNDATNQYRVTTSPQATIWLVARECLKRPSLTAKGIQLARRAVEASRLQNGPSFTIAILSEWIEIADQSGDKETVESLKSELAEFQRRSP